MNEGRFADVILSDPPAAVPVAMCTEPSAVFLKVSVTAPLANCPKFTEAKQAFISSVGVQPVQL
jgi:hypothetical protein